MSDAWKPAVAMGIVVGGLGVLAVAIRRILKTPAPVTVGNVRAAVTGAAELPDKAGGG